MVKTNENQSIRTHKCNPIFCGKGHLRLLLTPWNMKNLTFGPKRAKLCKRLRKVTKLKFVLQVKFLPVISLGWIKPGH